MVQPRATSALPVGSVIYGDYWVPAAQGKEPSSTHQVNLLLILHASPTEFKKLSFSPGVLVMSLLNQNG